MSFSQLRFRLQKLLLQRFVIEQCGHKTPIYGYLKAYDTVRGVKLHDNEGAPLLCFDCLNKATIPCAWCGQAIFPGDPVTLCSPRDAAYQPPAGAVTYSENPLRYVGCLHIGCSEGGMDRQGFWVPPKGVQRVLSPIEQLLQSDAGCLVIHDLSDPAETVFIRE